MKLRKTEEMFLNRQSPAVLSLLSKDSKQHLNFRGLSITHQCCQVSLKFPKLISKMSLPHNKLRGTQVS